METGFHQMGLAEPGKLLCTRCLLSGQAIPSPSSCSYPPSSCTPTVFTATLTPPATGLCRMRLASQPPEEAVVSPIPILQTRTLRPRASSSHPGVTQRREVKPASRSSGF